MLQREIRPLLAEIIQSGKSVLLLGPRQTGKTTLLKTFPHTLYLTFAKARVRLDYERDPSRLEREIHVLAENSRHGKKPLVILDEIQKVPQLMDQVQDLIDEKLAQFILTGSSTRKLRRSGQLNLLPGRVISLKLDPLTYAELPSRKFEDHLLHGDLPEIALENSVNARSRLLRSYVETYLDEEVNAEALVRGIGPFARFLELAAIEAGKIVNFAAISKQVGPSIHTIANYYEVLIDCLIAERVEPISRSATRKKLTKSPKILFFDMGVRRIAAREGTRLIPERMGELFEQWVGLELVRGIRNQDTPAVLHFWRDPDGPEVDWVLSRDDQMIPIEVKWTESTTGYVVCRVSRPQRLSRHVTAIPWQELAQIYKAARERSRRDHFSCGRMTPLAAVQKVGLICAKTAFLISLKVSRGNSRSTVRSPRFMAYSTILIAALSSLTTLAPAQVGPVADDVDNRICPEYYQYRSAVANSAALIGGLLGGYGVRSLYQVLGHRSRATEDKLLVKLVNSLSEQVLAQNGIKKAATLRALGKNVATAEKAALRNALRGLFALGSGAALGVVFFPDRMGESQTDEVYAAHPEKLLSMEPEAACYWIKTYPQVAKSIRAKTQVMEELIARHSIITVSEDPLKCLRGKPSNFQPAKPGDSGASQSAIAN